MGEVEPLIPVGRRRHRYPGRKPIPDRLVLNGILHVLHTGIAGEDLPQEYGYGSGVTAWRRRRDWQQAGVWERLHQRLLDKRNAAGAIDWSRAAVDGSHVRALWGAFDRALAGRSVPHRLNAPSSGRRHGHPAGGSADRGQSQRRTQRMPLLDDLHTRPVAGKVGRPRPKPDQLPADRGYDHDKYRRLLWARGIKPVIARRQTAHGPGRGRHRWVIERDFAHLHNFRRLRTRYQRLPEIHTALLVLACSILR